MRILDKIWLHEWASWRWVTIPAKRNYLEAIKRSWAGYRPWPISLFPSFPLCWKCHAASLLKFPNNPKAKGVSLCPFSHARFRLSGTQRRTRQSEANILWPLTAKSAKKSYTADRCAFCIGFFIQYFRLNLPTTLTRLPLKSHPGTKDGYAILHSNMGGGDTLEFRVAAPSNTRRVCDSPCGWQASQIGQNAY